MSDQHTALIKTPRQLITVVVLAFVVPVLVIVLATIELDAPTLTVPKFCADGIVSAGVPAPAVCPVPLTATTTFP